MEYFMQGVHYLPWVGDRYGDGFRGPGQLQARKILILGESCYHYNQEDLEKNDGPDFTRDCIRTAIDRVDTGSPIFQNIEQAFLNEARQDGWAPSGGAAFWNSLAFYNFVQSPVLGGPRTPPTKAAFLASWAPFRIVLEALRPERVVVCGTSRLWPNMEPTPPTDRLHVHLESYRLEDGTNVPCLATYHPSSARYSWRKLHPILMAFFDDPQLAAALLKKNGELDE